jgi:hypothetical protein
MKSKILQWLAITLMLESGVLHLLTAQTSYDKTPYLGYLFMANLLGALIAAFGIYHRQTWGWVIGLIVSLSSIAGFFWNRTLGGISGIPVAWLYPYGLVTVASAGLFILLTILRPWRWIAADSSRVSAWVGASLSIAMLVLIGLVTYSTFRWDTYAKQVGYHEHVGSLDAVCSTPFTSFAELEEKYGIQVSLVVVSAMDSIVDVRLKVIDPEKAHSLLVNQAALLVDQKALILAPHLHAHWRLVAGNPFIMFFPTQNKTVQRGSEVSLVFGHVRVAPVTVR